MGIPIINKIAWLSFLIIVVVCFNLQEAHAQKKARRLKYEAERQIGKRLEDGRVEILIGNVQIKQESTFITADSAVVNKKGKEAEAFGNVRVQEGDSIDITAKKLFYEGETGTARMREDVVYRDGKVTLYTNSLDYNKFDGTAAYYGGGRLIDAENTLTSDRGVFDKFNNLARFGGNVKIVMPDATITGDSLVYSTGTKIAHFFGPTKIVRNDGATTYAEEGLIYDTKSESTTVLSGNVENEDYTITGENLKYDQLKNVFTATKNVVMVSKKDDVIIEAQKAVYDKNLGVTTVSGNPLMKKPVSGDTLYLAADTMISIQAKQEMAKRLLAYNNVKIYKKDMQGIADSLAYIFIDTTIYMYKDPVLWQEKSQMQGDTISIILRNNTIDKLNLLANSFIISKDTIGNFNQVKGRDVVAFFKEGDLQRVSVNGNGESIYYVLEEPNNDVVGLNRITSGDMMLYFVDNKVQKIHFYQKPEGVLIPPHEIQEPDTRLSGFEWRIKEKPELAAMLKRKVPAAEKKSSDSKKNPPARKETKDRELPLDKGRK